MEKEELSYPYVNAIEELVFEVLGDCVISTKSYTKYSGENRNGESLVKTSYRKFEAEKLDRLVMEKYEIRGHGGLVVNAYTKPEFGIPILTLQLGGSGPDRTLAIIDIIGTGPETDLAPIQSLYGKFEGRYSGTDLEWVEKITSDYPLVNQYEPIDPGVIYESFKSYLSTWLNEYYVPATELNEQKYLDHVFDSVLKFKQILHENDVGLDLYEKNFNANMLKTIEQVAFGGRPSLVEENIPQNQNTNGGGREGEGHSGVNWTDEALNYLNKAPAFVRERIRKNAREKAEKNNVGEIDVDFIDNLR